MKKWLWLGTFLFWSSGLLAQQNISIAAYLTARTGDSLFFQNAIQPELPATIFTYFQTDFRKQSILKRLETNGNFRYESLSNQGFQLALLHLSNGTEILPTELLLLLPTTVSANQTYRDTSRYTLLRAGTPQGTGTLTSEVLIESFTSAETPSRNFANCLVVLIRLSYGEEIYESKEWYAKGIGLVKVLRKSYRQDASGKQTNVQSGALLLQKAFLNGKWMEGKPVRKLGD